MTRGSGSAKSRRGSRALLVALLGLGVAAGAGAFAFWYGSRAPEPGQPGAQPTELAAADSGKKRAKPAAAKKRPRKRRTAKAAPRPARRRASPSRTAAPSAAAEPDLPAAALESKVAVMKRPQARPRIAASEPAEPRAAGSRSGALPRPMDPAEIPGRHKRSVLYDSDSPSAPPSQSAPAPSVAVWTEAPEPTGGVEKPASSQAAPPEPAPRASRPAPEETEPRFEQPPETVPEPLVVAVAPEPEPPAPEPRTTPARGSTRPAAAPPPLPTDTEPAAAESSKQPVKSAAVAPREPEPGEAASSEIARAEVPGLRVERTVWHPIAERRLALIEFEQNAERREIREGDAVGPLVVSKIEPSGVVFVHDGVEVRRRIGE